MMMKYSWLVFVMCAALSTRVYGWSEEEKNAAREKVLPIVRECSEEFGVTKDELNEWKKEKKINEDHGCLYACILKKLNVMDDKGLFSAEGAIKKSKEFVSNEEDVAKVTEAAQSCTAVNDEEVNDGEKGCDRAKLIYACVIRNADKFGFA